MHTSLRWIVGLVLVVGGAAPAAGQISIPRTTITRPTQVAPTFGRYRVVIQGVAVAAGTADPSTDGAGDEIYVGAAFVLWDRRDGHTISIPNVIRTTEYGDIAGRNGGRIAAGTASPSGGLWGRNGGDYAPAGFTSSSTSTAGASAGALPQLVFEGGLSDGVEALLLVPSIWESDGKTAAFDSYANTWKTAGVGSIINAPAVQNQLTGDNAKTLMSLMVPADQTLQKTAALIGTFLPGVLPVVIAISETTNNGIDRPIGLAEYSNIDQYQDRLVVITHEKLASLTVGTGTTLVVPFAEPMNGKLNGLYQLYVRVERIQ